MCGPEGCSLNPSVARSQPLQVTDAVSISLWILPFMLFSSFSGLTLRRYPEDLQQMMSSLMVAPLATKFLFWKKVCVPALELPL